MIIRHLWTCPHFGRQFTNRNQSHACQRYTVEDHLADVNLQVTRLYERFVELINNRGEVLVEATKTSTALKSPGLFAVVHMQKKGLKVGFWLPRRIEHPRISRIEAITPQEYVYKVKLISLDDFDVQLHNWLYEAYAVGM